MKKAETKLQRAVIRQLGGRESLKDVAIHGAQAGFSGFTYYNETSKFFRRHRADIAAMVKALADDLGETPIGCVKSFNCLKNEPSCLEDSIGRAIYGGEMTDSDEDTLVENALAWFALEEVAHQLTDE